MINITTDQKVDLTISPLSALGRVVPNATITGVPLWNSSDVNIASLVIAADGFSAYAMGTGSGTATISVIANAGTSNTVVQINGSIQVTVAQAPAASLSMIASAPVSQ
jgi:hypothetical protein